MEICNIVTVSVLSAESSHCVEHALLFQSERAGLIIVQYFWTKMAPSSQQYRRYCQMQI